MMFTILEISFSPMNLPTHFTIIFFHLNRRGIFSAECKLVFCSLVIFQLFNRIMVANWYYRNNIFFAYILLYSITYNLHVIIWILGSIEYYSLFSTIPIVMTQLHMLYSCWLDQDIAPYTIFSLASWFWRQP